MDIADNCNLPLFTSLRCENRCVAAGPVRRDQACEFMHFCCHVDENWFVRHCPLVNTIRRHHSAHHNQSIMMRRNMNLTFPLADWLFGTSDLNRGLLGHLFNGYSTAHIKPD